MSPEETVRGQSAEGRQRDAADCVDELKDVKESLAEAEEALEGARESALHDFLTKLSNRELFEEKLSTAIAIAGRRRWSLAVFFIDIDSFKAVNDAVGHEAGDTVLKETARRLLECSREEDTVARHGGDEFIYLLIDPQNRKNITAIVSRLLERVSRPIEIGGQSLAISVSLGISVYPEDGQESERLIQNSDTAMYRAKNQKTGWQFYSNETSS